MKCTHHICVGSNVEFFTELFLWLEKSMICKVNGVG